MSLGSRISAARRKKGWSQGTLAVEIGSNQSTISDWERDHSTPNHENLASLAELLGLPVATLTFGESQQEEWNDNAHEIGTTKAQTPLVGDIGAGGQINPIDDHAKGGGLDYVETPPGAPKGTVAVRVAGTSLYPLLKDGALIYYSTRMDNVIDFLHELIVCHLADGRKCIKTLTMGTENGKFTLISNNAPPMLNEEVESVSPIDWMRP